MISYIIVSLVKSLIVWAVERYLLNLNMHYLRGEISLKTISILFYNQTFLSIVFDELHINKIMINMNQNLNLENDV